jgi:cytochrome c oxidase subunit 2
MKVDVYERVWMWGVGVMLALFFASTAWAAIAGSIQPPSHVETIDPHAVFSDPRFKPQGVTVDASGHLHARLVGMTFAWLPTETTLPAGTPVTFHVTSIDVIHGFEIVRTNGQTMAIPGYISQFTTQFEPGEYLIVCNEYCGVGHHLMSAKLHVVPRSQYTAPAMTVPPSAAASVGGEHVH